MSPQCGGCGGFISGHYHRVLADDTGWCLCPECRVDAYVRVPQSLGPVAGTYRSSPP